MSSSLLDAYPKMWRQKKRALLITITSVIARTITAQTAILAAWGFPAPNTFETRVLQKGSKFSFRKSNDKEKEKKTQLHDLYAIEL